MFSGFGKYKKYIDELTAILDASSEIIFLCNNFDITRIQDLFINIIENYNYYEQGKNETSKTELLGDEISGSAEYIKMKEYIDKNFENIKDKCDCFTIKLDGFRRQYLPDNAETEDSDDALIRDNFKSQYKTIRINLEDIERELNKIKKITENDIKAIKDDDIQFNIFPITKSNMMYLSGFYSSFKMIFKNLQIINSNENEITEEELEEINNDLKKLYINLIKNFNVNTINAQELVLKDIIAGLNNEGTSLKNKYDSYIKKGGDVKGEVDEGEEGKGKGKGEVEGEGKVEGKGKGKGKGEVEGNGKGKGKDEGEGEDEGEDAVDGEGRKDGKVKGDREGKGEGEGEGEGNGENVKNLEEEAERKKKEAEEAKKKAAAAAEEERKKEEAKEKEKKDEEEAAKKKAEEETWVLNFEYNNNSCYVNSALQMLIDNDELCVEIVKAANDKNVEKIFNKDPLPEEEKISDEYLLYLLYKIIIYHRKERHHIGDPKKPSYNEYIYPLREYLLSKTKDETNDKYDYDFRDAADLFKFLMIILNNLNIQTNNYRIVLPLEETETSLENLIKKNINELENIPNDNNYSLNIDIVKPITLPHNFNLFGIQYKLKGFIHFIEGGHFVYYKLLNSENKEWILLDDYDARNVNGEHISPILDSNNQKIVYDDNDAVQSKVLGKNGEKIEETDLPKDGKVFIYYKKDVNVLNESPKEDDPDLQAGIAASLADQKPVKNIVGNYTFEKKPPVNNGNRGLTHIYEDKNFKYNEVNKEDTVKLMASLNAGHENLRIGGGTINKRFNEIIRENNPQQISEKDLQNLSVKMHISCYMNCYKIQGFNSVPNVDDNNSTEIKRILALVNAKVAENKEGQLYPFDKLEDLFPNTIIEKMFLYIPPLKNRIDNKFKFNDTNLIPGDIFIDILRYNANKNVANKAMIYCVGPQANNTTNDKLFIEAINNIGKNIASAIKEYNKDKDSNSQRIDYVRICLISGGSYKPDGIHTRAIAKALIEGIIEINEDTNIIYNFAYVEETGNSIGSYKLAFDELNKKAPPP